MSTFFMSLVKQFIYFSAKDYSEFPEGSSKCICAKWKNYADSGSKIGKKYYFPQ